MEFYGIIQSVSSTPPARVKVFFAAGDTNWYNCFIPFTGETVVGCSIRGNPMKAGQKVDIISCGTPPEVGFIEYGYGSAYALPKRSTDQCIAMSEAAVALSGIAYLAGSKVQKYQPATVTAKTGATMTVQLRTSQAIVTNIGFDSPYTANLSRLTSDDFNVGDDVLVGKFGSTYFVLGWWYPKQGNKFWLVWASWSPSVPAGMTFRGYMTWHFQQYLGTSTASTPISPIYDVILSGQYYGPSFQTWRAHTHEDSDWIIVYTPWPYYINTLAPPHNPSTFIRFNKVSRTGVATQMGGAKLVSQIAWAGYPKKRPFLMYYADADASRDIYELNNDTNRFRILDVTNGAVWKTLDPALNLDAYYNAQIDDITGFAIRDKGTDNRSQWDFYYGRYYRSPIFGDGFSIKVNDNSATYYYPFQLLPIGSNINNIIPYCLMYHIPSIDKIIISSAYHGPIVYDPTGNIGAYRMPGFQLDFPDFGSPMKNGKIMGDHRLQRYTAWDQRYTFNYTMITPTTPDKYEIQDTNIVIPDNPRPWQGYYNETYLILPGE